MEGAAAQSALQTPRRSNDFRFGAVDVRLDSLEHAVVYYREVRADFARKRLGCRVLTLAHDLAKRNHAAVLNAVGNARAQLDDRRAARLDSAEADVREVDRTYAAVRC
jgi:hypothetical protein